MATPEILPERRCRRFGSAAAGARCAHRLHFSAQADEPCAGHGSAGRAAGRGHGAATGSPWIRGAAWGDFRRSRCRPRRRSLAESQQQDARRQPGQEFSLSRDPAKNHKKGALV